MSPELSLISKVPEHPDLMSVEKLIALLTEPSRSEDFNYFKSVISAVGQIINRMEFKYGSVRILPEVPWDHLVAMSEIVNANHDLARDLLVIIQDPTYLKKLSKELELVAQKLMEIHKRIKNDTSTQTTHEGSLEALEKEAKLEGISYVDDSLDPEIQGFTYFRAVTNFYRDHVALENIRELMQSGSRLEIDLQLVDRVPGLIISIAEELKKLSFARRDALSEETAPALREHKVSMLERLWLYKKSRDAIRHAVDSPEYMLKSLEEWLHDMENYDNFFVQMSEDEAQVSSYCAKNLAVERKTLAMGQVEEKINFLKAKLETVKPVEKPQTKKKNREKKKGEKEEAQWVKGAKFELLEEKELSDANFNELKAFLIDKLKANKEGQKDSGKIQEINKMVDDLLHFLKSDEIGVFANNFDKLDKAGRGRVLGKIKSVCRLQDYSKHLRDHAKSPSEKQQEYIAKSELFARINNYLTATFMNEGSASQQTKIVPEVKQEDKKKVEEKFWSNSLNQFIQELAEYCRLTVVKKEALNTVVKTFGHSKPLFNILLQEFIGKGFHVHPTVIGNIRAFSDMAEERNNLIFSQLMAGEVIADHHSREEIKTKFKQFFFGTEDLGKLFEDFVPTIRSSKARKDGKNAEKMINQFNNIFDNPKAVQLKSQQKIPIKVHHGLRKWEIEFRILNLLLLNIRMLLSKEFKKIMGAKQALLVSKGLDPSKIAEQIYEVHYARIFERLGEAEKLLKKFGLELEGCQTFGEIIGKLGNDAYSLITHMALISQHVVNINYLSVNYISHCIKLPEIKAKLHASGISEEEFLTKFKTHFALLRTCGNTLAHMDLAKTQQLDKLFDFQTFSEIRSLLEASSAALKELINIVSSAFASYVQAVARTFDFHASVDRTDNPFGENQFIPLSKNVLKFAYPHSVGSFCALAQFGIYKKVKQPAKNPTIKDSVKEEKTLDTTEQKPGPSSGL